MSGSQPTDPIDIMMAQIKAATNGAFARVSAAASFEDVLVNYVENAKTPAAYVVPLGWDLEPQQNATGYFQDCTAHYGVCVLLANPTGDAKSIATAKMITSLTFALISALGNFEIDPIRQTRPTEVTQVSAPQKTDRAYTWFQVVFSYPFNLTTDDTYQPTGTPFTSVNLTIENDGTNMMGADIDLPQ